MMSPPVLEIRDLVTSFRSPAGRWLSAVDGVSLRIPASTTIGVVGESGCGKSVTAMSILRLIREPGRISAGQILYRPQREGAAEVDLLALPERALRGIRGDRIAMIFQEPMTSLNPVYTVGDQVGEVLRVHRGMGRAAAQAEAARLFQLCGIADPERRVHEYPHLLSGGMRQRVMIAMALACGPDLLIADEPTTALDVTIQAQILDLLGRLQQELGMAILLITHDLGVVAQLCAEVVVMYAGQVVEQAPRDALFAAPRHPYTAGLLRSVPRPRLPGAAPVLPPPEDALAGPRPQEQEGGRRRRARLQEIPGVVPRLADMPLGCRFRDRCPSATALCEREAPPLRALLGEDAGRLLRCHHPVGGALAQEAA